MDDDYNVFVDANELGRDGFLCVDVKNYLDHSASGDSKIFENAQK